MMGLTRTQHEGFAFIASRIRETAIAPTYAEIAQAMKYGSRGTAHRLVDLLVERGYLRRIPHRARALEIVANTQADATGGVPLRPEIRRDGEAFAREHKISLETAVNEACRVYFGAAE